MIKQAFQKQALQQSVSLQTAEDLWQEIEMAYTETDRYFHTLDHLEHLFRELLPLQHEFDDWGTVVFSLCYHDVVYDVTQNIVAGDNVERSAAVAEARLKSISYPPEKIERCKAQVLATKKHRLSQDSDTNLFTDADLSILGQPWETYSVYANNIRKEYQVYSDNIYNAGRRKVLEYFFRMEPLFKTHHFHQRYEAKAKENLQKELRLLRG